MTPALRDELSRAISAAINSLDAKLKAEKVNTFRVLWKRGKPLDVDMIGGGDPPSPQSSG
jgi:hypothetical protein